jgi:hypothetical protein
MAKKSTYRGLYEFLAIFAQHIPKKGTYQILTKIRDGLPIKCPLFGALYAEIPLEEERLCSNCITFAQKMEKAARGRLLMLTMRKPSAF